MVFWASSPSHWTQSAKESLRDYEGHLCGKKGVGIKKLDSRFTLPLSTPRVGVYFPSVLHIDRNIDLVSLNRLKCKNGANRSDSRPSTPLSRVIKTNRRPSEVGLCYLTGDALAPPVCLSCSAKLTQSYPGSPLLPEEGQWLPAGSSSSPLKGNSGVNTYRPSHKLLGDVS